MDYVLILSCPDRPGIVGRVASFLADQGCNIVDSAQFGDVVSKRFFMRVEFQPGDGSLSIDQIREMFAPVGENFAMTWAMRRLNEPVKAMIFVSKFDHCLHDLLYRCSINEINIDVTGVISNHLTSQALVETYGLPFHHLPITKDTKFEQEAKIKALVEETQTELLVLARYMQILSSEFCSDYEGRIINIHHSFLPSFKGARPYAQAYAQGVKLMGATAHFVTPDLDEGPIIEQDVTRVDHSASVDEMVAKGRDVERMVLMRAVRAYSEHRILLNGQKTVVF